VFRVRNLGLLNYGSEMKVLGKGCRVLLGFRVQLLNLGCRLQGWCLGFDVLSQGSKIYG
jgi:hypothetical protein